MQKEAVYRRLHVLTVLISCLQDCFSGPADCNNYSPSTNIWPLGEGICNLDIFNASEIPRCPNNIAFNTGSQNLDYMAMAFSSSYIDLSFSASTVFENDYALQFYLYPEADGVFLHYKSVDQSSTTTGLKSIKLAYMGGNIETIISDGTEVIQKTTANGLSNNVWYRLSFGRDISNTDIFFVVDGVEKQTTFGNMIADVLTSSPGTFRVGGSHEGNSSFIGRVTCLQLITCRNPLGEVEYDVECKKANWPVLPMTTTSTLQTGTTTAPPQTTLTTTTTTTVSPTTTTTVSPTSTVTTPIPIASYGPLQTAMPPLLVQTRCMHIKL